MRRAKSLRKYSRGNLVLEEIKTSTTVCMKKVASSCRIVLKNNNLHFLFIGFFYHQLRIPQISCDLGKNSENHPVLYGYWFKELFKLLVLIDVTLFSCYEFKKKSKEMFWYFVTQKFVRIYIVELIWIPIWPNNYSSPLLFYGIFERCFHCDITYYVKGDGNLRTKLHHRSIKFCYKV